VSHHDKFGEVLLSLHEAALDDALWPAASGRIDEACGMLGNSLVVGKGHSQEDGQIFFARICFHGQRVEEWEQSYFDNYYPQDERVPRVTQLPDSQLVHMGDLFTEDERRISATYNEALLAGGYQNGLNVRLDGPEGCSIFWTLADSIKRGGWSSREITLIESFLPHIRHFLRVRHALGGAQALSASLSGLLDDTRLGVIYLDRSGRIIETNDRAMGLLRRGRGLFEQDGFLCARVPADDTRLQGLVADALPTFVLQATGGSMTVLRWPSRSRQVVHVVPVGDRQKDFGIGRVAVLVLVVEPGSPEQLEAELVASALGLTETESQVAVALAMGKSVTEIANEKGQRVSTARFHVKRIHTKLGLSRQMDLIRLVLSLGDAPGARGSHPE
jgi:DNA-binding CsgD family transcriptional regulator